MTLPNFLIIGAAKAGTTSLHHYLRQHPDVFMAPREPRYFAREGAEAGSPVIWTRDAYERLFDGATTERAIGEASPQYLNHPSAPGEIATVLPDAKLVVSLRNPADRAYSSYLGRLIAGGERRTVDEALRAGTLDFERSLYHAPLSRYFERFHRSQIKVILFDDLIGDSRAVVQDLFAFLEIDSSIEVDTDARHGAAAAPRWITANMVFWKVVESVRAMVPQSMRGTGFAGRAHALLRRRPEPLSLEIRQRLLAAFRDDIAQTAVLIDRDLSHWK
jgi:hypothetical protein